MREPLVERIKLFFLLFFLFFHIFCRGPYPKTCAQRTAGVEDFFWFGRIYFLFAFP